MRASSLTIRRLVRSGLLVCAVVAVAMLQPVISFAQPRVERRPPAPAPPPGPGLWQKSIVGGQLGPWFTDELGQDITDSEFRLSASSTAFHLELFYQPHLVSSLYLDLNFGAVSRGDIRITQQLPSGTISSLGDATLYPVGAGLQWAPLAKSINTKFQPLIRMGGSLIIGTERLQNMYQDNFGYLIGVSSESRVDVGFYGGAGALFVLGQQFALRGEAKYQHAKFGKELFGVHDYSGILVLFGAAYLYR